MVKMRNQYIIFIFLLSILVCIPSIYSSPTPLSIKRSTLQSHVIGLGGRKPLINTNTNDTSPTTTSSKFETVYYTSKFAVLTVELSSPISILRKAVNVSSSPTPLRSISDPSSLYGIIRLICGTRIYDSHPSHALNNGEFKLLPDFLFPTPHNMDDWISDFPILSTVEPYLSIDDQSNDGTLLRAVLHMSWARGDGIFNHEVDDLSSCNVRILPSFSQSHKPTADIYDHNGKLLIQPLRSPVEWIDEAANDDNNSRMMENQLPHAAANMLATILHTSAEESMTMLETNIATKANSKVQFKGLLQGLLMGLLSPIKKMMGSVIGDITAGGILDPIAQQVASGLGDSLSAGMAPYISSDIVVQIIPGITEIVVSSLTETLASMMAEAVTKTVTPPVTAKVTELVSDTIVKPVTGIVSAVVSVSTAEKIHANIVHILSQSIPHIVVPSLIHTISVSVKEDYYCYFCQAKQVYCQFCNNIRHTTMSRTYYGLYYTGYHCTYYSHYYASHGQIGSILVQKKELAALDEVVDTLDKNWEPKRAGWEP